MRRAVKILNAKKLKSDKSVIFNRSANQTANRRPYIGRLREFCGWIDIIKGQNVSDVDSPTEYTKNCCVPQVTMKTACWLLLALMGMTMMTVESAAHGESS